MKETPIDHPELTKDFWGRHMSANKIFAITIEKKTFHLYCDLKLIVNDFIYFHSILCCYTRTLIIGALDLSFNQVAVAHIPNPSAFG